MNNNSKYLKTPVTPFEVKEDSNISDILERMGETAFQGKNLSIAVKIWRAMLEESAFIFFGLAGAMVPAGMRKALTFLIKNRLIDCLVSTGANLFHDIHETVGKFHWQGSPNVDDVELEKHDINRIYDVFASDKEFYQTDRVIADFAAGLDKERSYTTREFLYLLGADLSKKTKEEGILTSAYKMKIPVYCPAVADSSIGISLLSRHVNNTKLVFDIVRDIEETTKLVMENEPTGVIYVGGGVPKNFIQQTEVATPYLGHKTSGHKYAIQFTCDPPHWGGLSGCTFEEAQSWGKVAHEAKKVTCYCDATIALPLVITALAQGSRDLIKRRLKLLYGRKPYSRSRTEPEKIR